MNIEKFFNMAKITSKLSDYSQKNIHIGAVLVYKNKIIANGWNTDKTNPLQFKYNKYRENADSNRTYKRDNNACVHAEMKCLIDTKDLDIDWNKVTIFVYREHKGIKRNCCPCVSCTKALKDRGIHNIFYTDENGFNYKSIE